jgi:Ca-activated chloride channel homolog
MLVFDFLWALLLLPLPLLIRLFLPSSSANTQSIQSPAFAYLSQLHASASHQASFSFNWRMMLLSLIWVLLVSAAARPQWLGEVKEIPTQARNIVLAVDISGSMSQQDMSSYPAKKDRLTIVKEIIADFIKLRNSDRLSLVLFGSQAYIHVPLTLDHTSLNTLLQEATIGIAGKYTAIGDALGLSIKALDSTASSIQKGMIILLTDGRNNAGKTKPLDIANLALELKVKIHTIGIGSNKDNSIAGFFFKRNPSADLDSTTLKKIATTTGGKFFRATDKNSLQNIYSLIDQLDPTAGKGDNYRPIIALYCWPLSIALVCILLLISSFMLRQVPHKINSD